MEDDFFVLFPDFFLVERDEDVFPFFLDAAEESENGISMVSAKIQISHTDLTCLNIISLIYRISMQGGKW